MKSTAIEHLSMSGVIGYSEEGRPIEAVFLGDESAPTTLLIGAIHGEEPAGAVLLEATIEALQSSAKSLIGSRVVIVPVANPDGFARGERRNARGVDLNRNFPARNHRAATRHGDAPLSESESRAIAALIERIRPTVVVSIHQPLRCVDYDGPAQSIAERMAAACDLPVRRLGGRPGSLGSWVGEDLGVPIVTLELPGAASRWPGPQLWERYGGAILAALDSALDDRAPVHSERVAE
ncbi:MAG: DUF2817 domain-containing protein [Phycisphaerales bacterium]